MEEGGGWSPGGALGRGSRLHDDRAGGVVGGTSGVGEPAGTAYRVAALQIAVLVAKGRDVDLHGRCGAAPLLAPQHRAVRPASRCPPGARARTAQGARPGPGSAARGAAGAGGVGLGGAEALGLQGGADQLGPGGGACGPESVPAGVRGHAGRRHPGLSCPAGSGSAGRHPRVGASGGRKMIAFEIVPGWGWLRLSC